MQNSLEDFSEDIVSKAQSGLKRTNRELAEQASVPLADIKRIKNGEALAAVLRKVALVLRLDPECLVASANRAWHPRAEAPPEVRVFVSHFHDMTVNAYMVHPRGSRECVLFDTGVDPTPILETCEKEEYLLKAVVLTHGHPDHVAALPELRTAYPDIPVFSHPLENIGDTRLIEWNIPFTAGPLQLRPLETPGHSPGGTSLRIQNFHREVCIVGDALFAGSVGGCASDYERSLRCIRRHILDGLPGQTLLCPGHGPVTTVHEEKVHNPFFAG